MLNLHDVFGGFIGRFIQPEKQKAFDFLLLIEIYKFFLFKFNLVGIVA